VRIPRVLDKPFCGKKSSFALNVFYNKIGV
jgi:hypothetical protein